MISRKTYCKYRMLKILYYWLQCDINNTFKNLRVYYYYMINNFSHKLFLCFVFKFDPE